MLVFAGTQLLPGDTASAVLGQNATPETLAAVRDQLHLDQPAVVQYAHWLAGLVHGDLGYSLTTHRPVAGIILDSLQNTLSLAAFSALIAVPLSLILGLISAAYPGSFLDPLCLRHFPCGGVAPRIFYRCCAGLSFCRLFYRFYRPSVFVSEFSTFPEKIPGPSAAQFDSDPDRSGLYDTDDTNRDIRCIKSALCGGWPF